MQSTTIAIDLAKSVFQLAVSDRPGHVAKRHRLSRPQIHRFLHEQAPARIVMEACGSAHYWAREAQAAGHQVDLLPPHAVRPYVTRSKTDAADAKALLEASRNEAILPVPVKSVEQQQIGSLHRLRAAWMQTRTQRLNTLRGLLRELGLAIPVGARRVVPYVEKEIGDPFSCPIPAGLRPALAETAREIRDLERRVREIERQLEQLARESAVITRLRTTPGVGLLTATALVAAVGDVKRFRTSRTFASYLGLTPRESSSGLRRRLGGISKRGDPYLRMLLIHGARSVMLHARRNEHNDRLRAWALDRAQARGHNRAAVALANKMARIVWALWRREEDYTPLPPTKA